MSENKIDEKQAKREARQLSERARAAFHSGDYRTARTLNRRILELAPDSDVGRQASTDLRGLSIDRRVLIAVWGTGLLYALAWLLGLHN